MQMHRRLTLTALLLMFAMIVAGCGKPVEITGTVKIAGEAPGANAIEILVDGQTETAVANAEGAFKLELKPGTYKLIARGDGVKVATVDLAVGKEPVTGIEIDLEPIAKDRYYLALDLDNPDHAKLITKPWPLLNYEIKKDRFDQTALFFPKGASDQAPPDPSTYQPMRFVVLDTPDIETFALSVDQIGEGGVTSTANGGNRSLSMVFGYQDPNNWWVAYYTYTNATRVARVIDGEQHYICRPLVEGQWWPNNDEYQTAYIRLERDGDDMVLRSYANGEPTSIDGCRFPAKEYTPGKIGLGGHSTSDVQSWYFRNVVIEEI